MKKIFNLAEMEVFAQQLAQQLEAGDVLLLDGDLGAGKTTFSQFLGRALGVKRTINSPTFNIIKSYRGSVLNFHHMDCYRLEDSEEDLGFDEYFNDDAVTVVEWSQFIEEYLPETFLKITITVVNETERALQLEAVGTHYEAIKETLEHV
ncbi:MULTISPECIES: tRNA (adenosine(37)-N6)-threonylcarbamoyltransferase complex ATPase subunit type 1 TsaE [unclassified Staphylococcus]|uniref:tRNA (adenosine(37)-N6)-threonylcarbamoyltransferase complex ATPase subunit type 1 TsaE n=1 Tax=unclassified Staphylococcus TaxID=91994 RepID=UPI0021CE3C6A|nr:MULTISPECIES: tRNA (adenosine(37)-N6)-threonylcarbamoyltransferase complex ATPase subunit type 1 TsaE [unclassified Staphylococcus]UXR73423.1 tRNA (adenosine(37)-N6)-threonylcarbamoyltransferase complex ATPase subunit type 1 TsaE [Staphylococcus sp. IVB6238]UXR75738.1 tRNA (adenosine(37)-N6)-threonylcarbamoyltransferase complex ATPase subunit type 1 TsaE [Staphylococcus sp. IVB6233]UXR79937.1 tRNA (adenosine(37)-N6)-threonylcarbamoyltransferase complex ATPase subunit type 1 TsaE [Staphylococc